MNIRKIYSQIFVQKQKKINEVVQIPEVTTEAKQINKVVQKFFSNLRDENMHLTEFKKMLKNELQENGLTIKHPLAPEIISSRLYPTYTDAFIKEPQQQALKYITQNELNTRIKEKFSSLLTEICNPDPLALGGDATKKTLIK